jgi:hypothetical protein
MRPATLLALAPVVWATACDTPAEPAAPAPLAAVQEVLGETGEGALYAMHMPEEWNGSLVLYAHGINSGEELTLEDKTSRSADGETTWGMRWHTPAGPK